MSATVIADLIERVGRAEGPDRKLDADLALASGWRNERYTDGGAKCMAFLQGHPSSEAQAFIADEMEVPGYTSSIDAALALVERFRDQGIDAATLLSDALDRLTREGFRLDQPLAPQLARALLIEFLTALQSQTPGPSGASNEGGR